MKETRNLVPEFWTRPWMLWWSAVLPQLVLLGMNARWWRLVSGEMSPGQLQRAFWVCAAEWALLAAHVALAAFGGKLRRRLNRAAFLALLGSNVAYLWLMLFMAGEGLLPQSVALWMIPMEQFIYYQFALLMPAVFHFLTALACFPRIKGQLADPALTCAVAAGIPVLWWLGIYSNAERFFQNEFWGLLLLILGVLSSVLMVGALIRALFVLVDVITERGHLGRGIFAALIAVAAPVGGLILNREIPFPVDFQSWGLYGLTVFNGLLLMVPAVGPRWFRRTIWVGRALMYPFSCYFFFVFLPFLPLSMVAMLAAGAGFLVMTPTVLFLFHTQVLAEGFRAMAGRRSRLTAVAGLALGVGCLPALALGGAMLDRVNLQGAIRYLYHSNPSDPPSFHVCRWMLQRSLNNMRDFKQGRHWPFLSCAYTTIVFDGLVLPDEKLQELHQAFFGQALDMDCARNLVRDTFSSGFRAFRVGTPPSVNAVMTDMQVDWMDEEECRMATVSLSLTNPTSSQTEFATSVTLPEGVMISGFWLYIDGKKVPARIFEKKTAMWVYRMIRDVTRRDPGLLYYTDRHHVDLRVFPVEAGQTRRVDMEFLYPANLDPSILIGDREIRKSPPAGLPGLALVRSPSNGVYLVASRAMLTQLPAVVRHPYLHFVADYSATGFDNLRDVLAQCRRVADQFPDIADCALTLANYEVCDVTDALWPVANLGELTGGDLPRRGGFCRDRAIRYALSTYAAQLEDGAQFLRYPLVVVLTPGDSVPVRDDLLKNIGGHLPDAGGFYTQTPSNELARQDWTGQAQPLERGNRPVVIMRVGGKILAAPVSAPGGLVALSFEGAQDNQVSYYNPDLKTFQSLETFVQIDAESRYGRGAEAWLLQSVAERDAVRAFQVRRLLHTLSRESGIMLPGTSYIVVENSAQWNMLKQTEKKKLKEYEELEVASTPEPATWGLMALAAAALALRKKAFRRSGRPVGND